MGVNATSWAGCGQTKDNKAQLHICGLQKFPTASIAQEVQARRWARTNAQVSAKCRRTAADKAPA
jgi:hypothetical protein